MKLLEQYSFESFKRKKATGIILENRKIQFKPKLKVHLSNRRPMEQ